MNPAQTTTPETPLDDLSKLSAVEIDALPFGYIALAADGTVRRYNRYESDLARTDPRQVLGQNFFRDVAPCTRVQEFEGRFESFVADHDGPRSLAFDFEFRFRHGTQKVAVRFVRSPLEREVIVTVNRRRDLALPALAEIRTDPTRGTFSDADGGNVVACGADFWLALDSLFADRGDGERAHRLRQLGRTWADRHLDRAEALVQERRGKALREIELQEALETLSGSLAVVGLGRFDAELSHRRQGLLVVDHNDSPFAAALDEREGARCDLLAGLHAGFFSYLAGRELDGREVACAGHPHETCRFVVGSAVRLSRFFDEAAGSEDQALRESIAAGRETIDAA
ncbi:MAG TPA: V4R domain-containing protein [Thermoanaerobaculia bacterium]|nr:V4R domain-containing protein [Thermoanaerobaculia bacterium]